MSDRPRIEEFYSFMRAREQVRLNREAGLPWPWTDDPILQTYKFTNVKRMHDRTTKILRGFYEQNYPSPPELQLFNCAIARYFGTHEFVLSLGWQNDFNPDHLCAFARDRLNRGERVFTGAYLITNNGIKSPKEEVVVRVFLEALWNQRREVVRAAHQNYRWEDVVTYMRQNVMGFGGSGFMAKEVILDTMFTNFWLYRGWPIDKATWSPAGPGARRGLNRLYGRDYKKLIGDRQALCEMRALWAWRTDHWPVDWVGLDVHDIQFQLCEWDKYERVRLGQGRPRSKYRPPKGEAHA